ncbi:MAG: alginate lyase family protein [Phycisphaerae bacterium]|nr:alginate lyase family protein [Phycisphaerae bacterium]
MPFVSFGSDFRHPGLLHSRTDLDRMKQKVAAGEEPWQSGFERFKVDQGSQGDYRLRGPGAEIGRSPSVNFGEYDQDANAAYQLALMWAITGDRTFAAKALEIVNAWSKTLKRVSGRDAVLMAGLGPFKMVNAAEILRYTDTGWSDTDIRQCEQMFMQAIYPAIRDFALFANGNWDIAAIQTVMAIGVFCNDRAVFEKGLRYYVNGAGNGRLTHYVINEAGQCQESGRDQQHTQLGLALLSACCEIAWHQGLDLFAYADYRLLAGFEYTAKYNLGEDAAFQETLDRTGKYHHTRISPQGRGRLRAVYEQVFNHYVNRVGMEAPYTQKAAERVRPEGPGRPSADHPGFGTLLFSRQPGQRDPVGVPGAPGGLVARGTIDKISLTWVAVVNADRYTIKRSSGPNEPFMTLKEDVTIPAYTDTEVNAGQVYTYSVSAAHASGQGPDAFPVQVCAGLPVPWSHQDVGDVAVTGTSQFDGRQFTLEGAGKTLCTDQDQMQFACRVLEGDGVIVARYVPQLSSQFTRMGLFMRESLDMNSSQAALLVTPFFGRNVEAPGWYARLYSRAKPGQVCQMKEAEPLRDPFVIQGRLLGACWLRLERHGDIFKGAVSDDGSAWTSMGQVIMPLKKTVFVGLGVCSGLDMVTTLVKFDQVTVSPMR